MVNTSRFVDTMDTMTDPFLRDITRVLMSDEIVHAQFGFMYLEVQKDWLESHPEVRVSVVRYLRHAFAIFEQQMSGAGIRPRTLTSDERALGLTDPARARLAETFYETITGRDCPGPRALRHRR